MAILTVNEFKTLAEITSDADDQLIEFSIAQAQGMAEAYCGRRFDEEPITEKHDGGGYYIELSQWPVVSISEVKEYDTVLDASDYELRDEHFLMRLDSEGYITHWTTGRDSVSISYLAGYEDSTAPQDLKMAIYILAFLIYKRSKMSNWPETSRSFEGGSLNWADDIPNVVKTTLDKYRSKRII